MGRASYKLKPLAKKRDQHEFERPITTDTLYRGFCKAGHLDRPDLAIPLQPIEEINKLRRFVEEHKAKKANGAMATSFFHVLRSKEDALKIDVQF